MDPQVSSITVLAGQAVERLWPAPTRLPREPIDWYRVPEALPVCFAALSADEAQEWCDLMTAFHEPGAYHRHNDDRAFYTRLAELDNKVDWEEGLYRPMDASQGSV